MTRSGPAINGQCRPLALSNRRPTRVSVWSAATWTPAVLPAVSPHRRLPPAAYPPSPPVSSRQMPAGNYCFLHCFAAAACSAADLALSALRCGLHTHTQSIRPIHPPPWYGCPLVRPEREGCASDSNLSRPFTRKNTPSGCLARPTGMKGRPAALPASPKNERLR